MGNCLGTSTPVHTVSNNTLNAATSSKATNSPKANLSADVSTTNSGDVLPSYPSSGGGTLRAFSYTDLRTATRNFRPDSLLGKGGFGSVFKGFIDEQTFLPTRPGQGIVVAVKKLNQEGLQGHKEWLAEVHLLGTLHHHPNLCKLIGYCAEDDHRLLVYEFMSRGSLENHLFRQGSYNPTLPWATRMKIAVDAARGLAFLHESQVIYRDFKASNILLDAQYNAKLSDFGLARNGPTGDNTHVSTRIIGTYGYAAPEYVATGHLTVKSDVYSFGVVLLEILTGRRAVDKSRPIGEQNLVDWAKPYLSENRRLPRIVDVKLEGYSMKGAQEVGRVASLCLLQEPRTRPTMQEILESLEPLLNTKELSRNRELQEKGASRTREIRNNVHKHETQSKVSHPSPRTALPKHTNGVSPYQSPRVSPYQSPNVGRVTERQ